MKPLFRVLTWVYGDGKNKSRISMSAIIGIASWIFSVVMLYLIYFVRLFG